MLNFRLESHRDDILPKQIPDPVTGGFDTHIRGGSHFPEKPPGPPHASPSVFAQTLQHLENKERRILAPYSLYLSIAHVESSNNSLYSQIDFDATCVG